MYKHSDVQALFVSILPRIEAHGRIYFRNVKCQATRDECLAEMVALSWQWFVRLIRKGKQPTRFVSAIASFAAKAVRAGRRLCGQEKSKDVLSPLAQRRKGFAVGKLPDYSTVSSTPLCDALLDNTVTPPDEQVCFRIDFPAWLATQGERRRRIAEDLMMGERTLDVAGRHGTSPARISQLRRELSDDWALYCA